MQGKNLPDFAIQNERFEPKSRCKFIVESCETRSLLAVEKLAEPLRRRSRRNFPLHNRRDFSRDDTGCNPDSIHFAPQYAPRHRGRSGDGSWRRIWRLPMCQPPQQCAWDLYRSQDKHRKPETGRQPVVNFGFLRQRAPTAPSQQLGFATRIHRDQRTTGFGHSIYRTGDPQSGKNSSAATTCNANFRRDGCLLPVGCALCYFRSGIDRAPQFPDE